MSVVTRFAPSPTGFLHIGGARTALFSWLHARRHGGRFILRVEDTDRDRSTEEATRAILEGMHWLGLDHDEGPYFQSERGERYREVLDDWLATGKAYYCFRTKEELDELREAQRARGEKPRYDGYWRDNDETPPEGVTPCIRFKNPLEGEVVFDDRIRGRVAVANAELDDLVICRSDGSPTYNFCVVVDDYDMGVTDVVRGSDLLPAAVIQNELQRGLGLHAPAWAHLPVMMTADGTDKLSKQTGAPPVNPAHDPVTPLIQAWTFLGQEPPFETPATPAEFLAWALSRWDEGAIPPGERLVAAGPGGGLRREGA